jgi:hypothetical protein
VYFGERIVVPKNFELGKKILDEAHLTRYSIHPGSSKILWTRMKREIAQYVSEYGICQ